MAYYFNDIEGKRFGRLVAVEVVGRSKQQSLIWKCKCDCGNYVNVVSVSLSIGNTSSCGCIHAEGLMNRCYRHGESKSKIYSIWSGIKGRCSREKEKAYKNYGGRGIKVCDEWNNSFENFRDWSLNNGYEEGLTIDRIDNNGNYEPNNCRWVSRKIQMNNMRRNRMITYEGETMTLSQLCDKYNKKYHLILDRLDKGKMTIEDAMTREKYKKHG